MTTSHIKLAVAHGDGIVPQGPGRVHRGPTTCFTDFVIRIKQAVCRVRLMETKY